MTSVSGSWTVVLSLLFACGGKGNVDAGAGLSEDAEPVCSEEDTESDCVVDGGQVATCGDAVRDEGEACDDANSRDGDGCSALCQVEPGFRCVPYLPGLPCAVVSDQAAPLAPALSYAQSMAPGSELWIWNKPEGTYRFELSLDGAAQSGFDPGATRLSPRLTEGSHTLAVRACNQHGRCSEWVEGTTTVEERAVPHVRGLQGAGRELARTELGRQVLVACDHCYGAEGQPITLEQSGQMLRRAIATNGADAVELPVALVQDKVAIIARDDLALAGSPTLSEVLGLSVLAENTSLLILDLVEQSAPEAFAKTLLDTLDAHPKLARNGRPLLLHASYARRALLAELAKQAKEHAISGPYLRFVLGDDPQNLQGASLYEDDGRLRSELAFVDAVSIPFILPNLFNRIARAHKAERGVFIDAVPGPRDGEVVLAGLRDQGDGFFTSYNAAQARALVSGRDLVSYVSAADATATSVTAFNRQRGSLVGKTVALNTAPRAVQAGHVAGSPALVTGNQASAWFGPALDFPDGRRLLALRTRESEALISTGFLLSAAAVFPSFDTNSRAAWLLSGQSKLETGESAYSLIGTGGELRGGALFWSRLSAANLYGIASVRPPENVGCEDSANGRFDAPLVAGRSYWVSYVLDLTSQQSTLFVDGRCAARGAATAGGGLTSFDLDLDWALGGFAQPDGTIGGGFTGQLQQAQAARFSSRRNDGEN